MASQHQRWIELRQYRRGHGHNLHGERHHRRDQGGNVTLSKAIVQGNTVKGGTAQGGGVFASGAGTLVLHDSILSDNSAQGSRGADGTAPGKSGAAGGSALGGGL